MTADPLRGIFDEDATLYDRARPGYPEALFDELVAAGAIGPGRRVLEIGAGTGQATLPMARRGSTVQAVELGGSLAAVLQAKVGQANVGQANVGQATDGGLEVSVATGAFEDYPVADQEFDAVVAFTAWHWLTPDLRVRKAADALRPGGVLATVTTAHVLGGTIPFFADAQDCYERWDPATPPGLRLTAAEDIAPTIDEVDDSDLFLPATRTRFVQDITYSAQSYLDVLNTYSGHRALTPDRRDGLLGCIRRLIETRYDGAVTKRYLYELRLARLRD